MDDFRYSGKFHYPPEIDPDNEIDKKAYMALYSFDEAKLEDSFYRPKSVFVIYL